VSATPFPGEIERQRRPFLVAAKQDAYAPSDLNWTGAYRFGPAPTRVGRRWAGPAHLRSSPGWIPACFFFIGKCSVILFVLQILKFHRICSINVNVVIQISLGSLDVYLSDGIGLIILGAL
jgi:hypothetical protein